MLRSVSAGRLVAGIALRCYARQFEDPLAEVFAAIHFAISGSTRVFSSDFKRISSAAFATSLFAPDGKFFCA